MSAPAERITTRAAGGGPGGPTPRRFPARVFRHGADPDPRFSLANERTFLAWVRTALARVAGGVALEALGLPLHPVPRLVASVACLCLGSALPLLAWREWARTEVAMRLTGPLPGSRLSFVTATGVALIAVVILVGIVLGRDG